MKEIKAILTACETARQQGLQTALATLVHVEGSSYRRPGARMLIREDGQLTGAISGGCLEGDALRKALQVIHEGQSKLVTYDSMDEDDAVFGLSLGCNGIVQVLIEPLRYDDACSPIKFLQEAAAKRQPSVLVTLFNLHHKRAAQPGTCLLVQNDAVLLQKEISIPSHLTHEAFISLHNKQSAFREIESNGEHLTCFFECLLPPVQLVIAGAGNDVPPVVEMATLLGWEVMVADGRPAYANARRFGPGCQVLVANPAELLQQVQHDDYTFYLLMTHNYQYDKAVLQLLLQRQVPYVGMLGPKKKRERMLQELAGEGNSFSKKQVEALHSPVGLDIGAETPEEIALSIIAEIKSLLTLRTAEPLHVRNTTIHDRSQQIIHTLENQLPQ